MFLIFPSVFHHYFACLSLAERLHGLEEDTQQDEGNAEVEREVDFATFTKDEESQDDGVAGLKIVSEVDGKGRKALQSLDLQQIHADGTEQRMTEHEPEVSALRNDDNGLLAGEEPQINGNDGRDDEQSA